MRIRTTLAPAIASLALVGAGALVPAQAVTGHVDNLFYCSTQTGKCRQVNGPYSSSVKVACKWVYTTYWTGSSTRVCDYWVR